MSKYQAIYRKEGSVVREFISSLPEYSASWVTPQMDGQDVECRLQHQINLAGWVNVSEAYYNDYVLADEKRIIALPVAAPVEEGEEYGCKSGDHDIVPIPGYDHKQCRICGMEWDNFDKESYLIDVTVEEGESIWVKRYATLRETKNMSDSINILCQEVLQSNAWLAPAPQPLPGRVEETDSQIAWKLSLSRDKPFFIDTFRALLNQYDKEEISLSKLVEELNVAAYKWAITYKPKTK